MSTEIMIITYNDSPIIVNNTSQNLQMSDTLAEAIIEPYSNKI